MRTASFKYKDMYFFHELLREASSAFENEGKLNEGKRCAANWKIAAKIVF